FSGTNNRPWLATYEYIGLSTLDRTVSAQGISATPSSGATPATTSANELVFAGFGFPASYTGPQTAGSGFTLLQSNTATSPAANESMLVTATGSFTGTLTLGSSQSWSAVVATFAAGGVSVTTTSLPGGTPNVAYTTTLAATGGPTPSPWSLPPAPPPPRTPASCQHRCDLRPADRRRHEQLYRARNGHQFTSRC